MKSHTYCFQHHAFPSAFGQGISFQKGSHVFDVAVGLLGIVLLTEMVVPPDTTLGHK